MPLLKDTYLASGTALTSGSGLGVGGVVEEAVDTAVTNYVTALNAARSTVDDFTDDETNELDAFVKSLKGTVSANYPDATDVWDNLRVLAIIDPVFGVGEGTTIIPIIADDGSGNPVDASDANQEDGSLAGSAPWGDYFNGTTQYASLPFPSASFDYLDYTVVAVLDSGGSVLVDTLLSVDVAGEAYNTANTSEWRWFSRGRLDGFGVANALPDTADLAYQNCHIAFARESLSTFKVWKNGELDRRTNLTAVSASTPTTIGLGAIGGALPGEVKPFAVALFDTVLTTAQVESIHNAMDRLRTSQESGGSLLITEGTTDDLLLEAATTDLLLLDA